MNVNTNSCFFAKHKIAIIKLAKMPPHPKLQDTNFKLVYNVLEKS